MTSSPTQSSFLHLYIQTRAHGNVSSGHLVDLWLLSTLIFFFLFKSRGQQATYSEVLPRLQVARQKVIPNLRSTNNILKTPQTRINPKSTARTCRPLSAGFPVLRATRANLTGGFSDPGEETKMHESGLKPVLGAGKPPSD